MQTQGGRGVITGDDPYGVAIEAMKELGRIFQGMAADAEVELRRRGIEPDPNIPVLDQLAEAEGLWQTGFLR